MIKPRPQYPLNPQIRTEATEWLLRFSEGEVDTAGREEFNYWLRTSPEHVRAYLRVSAFWQEAGHLDAKEGPRDIEALVARAKNEANVFPLALGPHLTDAAAGHTGSGGFASPPAFPSPPTPLHGMERGALGVDASRAVDACYHPSPLGGEGSGVREGVRRLSAIAAALLLAVGGLAVWYTQFRHPVYATAIGEQRTVNLPDGSTVILNADSRVRVRYSDTDRTIDLEEGQALFKVAKNPSWPFVVRSGEASVRAVGTQFDVYRKTTGTTVTVIEGKVASTTTHTPTPVFLTAGEQLTIPEIELARAKIPGSGDAAPEPRVRPVKVEEATAWTEGLLIFDGALLTDVIQEFNRQNAKPLVLQGGPELAELRISGTFPANSSERLIHFLEERFGVVVHESNGDIRLSRQ